MSVTRAPRGPSLRVLAHLPSESQLQTQIVEGLERLHYTVLQCGRFVRPVTCPTCGAVFVPTTGYGNTLGTPDLLVADPTWPFPLFAAIELKRPTVVTTIGTVAGGVLSREQKALAKAGFTVVCHSLEDVLDAVRAVRW